MYEEYLARITPNFCLLEGTECSHNVVLEDMSEVISMNESLGEFVSYQVTLKQIKDDLVIQSKTISNFTFLDRDIIPLEGSRDTVKIEITATFHAYNPDTQKVDLFYNYYEELVIERDCCEVPRLNFISEVKSTMAREAKEMRYYRLVGKQVESSELAVEGMSNIIWFLCQCGVDCEDLELMKCLFVKLKNSCLCV